MRYWRIPISDRPPSFGRPVTGAPPGIPLGPTSLRRDEIPDPTRWQLWWRFNHDPYLRLNEILERRRRGSRDANRERDLVITAFREHARPALMSYLIDGGHPEVVRESLLALARVGDEDDVVQSDLERYARFYLPKEHAELRAASLLALGIRGESWDVAFLGSVVADDELGRELLGGPVPERERAMASFALGLLGREASLPTRTAVVEALVPTLHDPDLDVRIAGALALGLVPLPTCGGDGADGEHVCGGTQLDALARLVLDPNEPSWLRAHTATSIGRIAGVIEDEDARADAASLLGRFVHPAEDETPEVVHGAALGLGHLADGDRDPADRGAREALEALTGRGDPMARRFALVALAQVAAHDGADPETVEETAELLTNELVRGRKGRKSWAAIALGVLGCELDRTGRALPAESTVALRELLRRAKESERAAALATALAMIGDDDPRSLEVLADGFERREDPLFRAYAATALGALAAPRTRELLEPELEGLPHLALVLHVAGDPQAIEGMVAAVDGRAETLDARLIEALGRTADARAIRPLSQLLQDERVDPAVRARAAWALGELGDGDPLAWDAAYANGLQYHLLSDTLRRPMADGLGLLDDR